jgi:tRNA pseudouridine-54 N-methylase
MLQKALGSDLAFHDWQVKRVDTPDASRDGVIVVDAESLERLRRPLRNPERVVLITRKGPDLLNRAWDAGIVSVVGDTDPLSTAMLAILAARFRARKAA